MVNLYYTVIWHKDDTYQDIGNFYVTFITKNYRKVIVVFNSHDNSSPSIKDKDIGYKDKGPQAKKKGYEITNLNFRPQIKFTRQKKQFLDK